MKRLDVFAFTREKKRWKASEWKKETGKLKKNFLNKQKEKEDR